MPGIIQRLLPALRRRSGSIPISHDEGEVFPMPDPTMMQEIDKHIVEHLDNSLHELSVLCRQPSVAAQNYGIQECAELVGDLLRARGFAVQILPSGGSPVVVADAPGRSSKTMLLYN